MILNNNNIHNSIAFNPMSDDLTYRGYAALACCIWGDIVNGIEIKPSDTVGKEERIKKAYGLIKDDSIEDKTKDKKKKLKEKSRTNKSFKYMNIRLIDINNGEIFKIFNNVSEASDFLGITDNRVNVYISTGYIRDKKYKIEADLNPNYVRGAHARTSVRVINVKTGFNKECETVKEAKEITGLSRPTIYVNARDKRVSKAGWKFEYIED